MREKVPSRDELKGRAGELGHSVRDRAADVGYRARGAVEEQPALSAIGALLLGGLAAFLVPVSDRERRAFRPVQQKAKQAVEAAGAKLESTLRGDEQAQASGQTGLATQAGSEFTSPSLGVSSPASEPLGSSQAPVPPSDSDLPSVH